jgi:hypothetical protein
VHWTGAVSVSNPLELTRAYAARFAALGGVALAGDARTLRRANGHWRVEAAVGPLDAGDALLALGPWASDVLDPLGVRLPLAVKRGYHRHFRPQGNAMLGRPVLDAENGYCLAPMEQGSASRPALNSPPATRRLRPSSSRVCCRRRGNCSRWANPSRRGPGSGHGRVSLIPGRSLGEHPGSPVSGSPSVTRIGA